MNPHLRTALRVILSFGLLGLVLWHAGVIAILERLRSADVRFLLLTLVLMLLDTVIRAWNWQLLMRAVGVAAPFRGAVYAFFTGGFWGCILPSSLGTDAARAAMATRVIAANLATAMATVVSLSAVGFFTGAIVGLAGAMWLFFQGGRHEIAAVAGSVFTIEIIVVLLIVRAMDGTRRGTPDWFSDGYPILKRLSRAAIRFAAAIRPFGTSHDSRRAILSVAFLSQILRPLGLAFAFAALGTQIPAAALVIWVPLAMIVSVIPVTLAGFGGRQAVYTYYFALFGVPYDVGFGVSMLHQVMELTVVVFGGVIFAFSSMERPRWSPVDGTMLEGERTPSVPGVHVECGR